MYIEAVRMEPFSLAYVRDHLKTQKMCNKVVRDKLYMMLFVPDHLKTMEMCNEITRTMLDVFYCIPDRHKTQDMCIKSVEVDPSFLELVPDNFKTQKMCDKAMKKGAFSSRFVPDWFVTQQQVKLWNDDSKYHDDDKLIKWHDGYKKRKAQKAKIEEELMSISWHPSRWWDWCVSEDEKKETEKLWK